MNSNEQDVLAVYEQWFRAMQAGDVQSALALVTEDVVFKGPGSPAAVGKRALGARLEAFHRDFSEVVSFEVQEVEVVSDWAYASVAEQATVHSKVGKNPVMVSGLHLSILRRDGQGGWRIARDVSSLDG